MVAGDVDEAPDGDDCAAWEAGEPEIEGDISIEEAPDCEEGD